MNKTLLAASISLLFAIQGCSDNTAQQTSTTTSTSAAMPAEKVSVSAKEAYLTMVDDFFQEQLKLEPIYATFVGVNEYNDQFGDSLSESYLKARHDLNAKYFALAKKIDVDALPSDLKLSYSMFIYDRDMALMSETYPEHFLPMNQFYNTDGTKKRQEDLELPYPDLSKFEIYTR